MVVVVVFLGIRKGHRKVEQELSVVWPIIFEGPHTKRVWARVFSHFAISPRVWFKWSKLKTRAGVIALAVWARRRKLERFALFGVVLRIIKVAALIVAGWFS